MVLIKFDFQVEMKGIDGVQVVGSLVVLYRYFFEDFFVFFKSEGNYLIFEDGWCVFDVFGGVVVSCIGYCNKRVVDVVYWQIFDVLYCSIVFYIIKVQEEFCCFLVDLIGGQMVWVYIVNLGKFFCYVVFFCF